MANVVIFVQKVTELNLRRVHTPFGVDHMEECEGSLRAVRAELLRTITNFEE